MDIGRTISGWIFCALLLAPSALEAQVPVSLAVVGPELTSVRRCGPDRGPYRATWARLNESAGLAPADAKRELGTLADSLTLAATQRPDDVDLHYLMAAVVGMRAELEGGLGQVEAAKEAHALAQAVLALDPDHPGAQHIVGRLHLEVLRMSRMKRFLATKVLGGSELAGASWESAHRLLVAGAVGDPCSIDHQYHLARFYAEVGDPGLARERLDALLGHPPRHARDRVVARRAMELRERLTQAVAASR